MNFDTIVSGLKVRQDWASRYKYFVPKFIKEAKSKNDWKEWNPEIFKEFFLTNRNQCVSSLQQGYFTIAEQNKIKENWKDLAPLLKKISENQNELDLKTYNEIKKWFKQFTSQNRKAATNRLIASLQPNLLSTIVQEDRLRVLMIRINTLHETPVLKITNNWFVNSNNVLEFFKSKIQHDDIMDIMTYPWQVYDHLNEVNDKEIKDNTIKSQPHMKEEMSILLYKKQIILQGPPGTGKTRLAKLLAKDLIKNEVNFETIISTFKVGQQIKSPSGNKSYSVIEIDLTNKRIYLKRESGTKDYTSFEDIISAFNNKLWDTSIEQNNPRRAASLAKYLFDNMDAIDSKQFNIVQFHPSYTYEDFVRGIVVEANGDKVEYRNVNKILGLFAERALQNYKDSQKDAVTLSTEIQLKDYFERFVDYINDQIENDDGVFMLTKSVGLISSDDENAFRYKGINEGWVKNGNRMLFKDILQAYIDGNSERQDIKKNMNVSGLARQHASYFVRVLNLFQDFMTKNNFKVDSSDDGQSVNEKKFVLVIDEINRANLSSVLGELIYALEYRGDSVDSIYEVDDSNQLILPPNLYIIGTMNTADRSVGHIDYAIRRRFAFVDVLPQDISNDASIVFHKELFESVKRLFTTDNYNTKSEFISEEFEPKDVALGHSYFIDQTKMGGTMEIRLKYEIKPILIEYIKDGILKESAKAEIERLNA